MPTSTLLRLGLIVLVIAWGPIGCLPASPDDDSYWPLQVLSGRAPRPPADGQYVENEPNDSYDTAEVVQAAYDVELVGDIAAGDLAFDQDLYELGPAQAGDRILASLDLDGYSDVVLGILDDQQRLLAYLDLTSSVTGPREIDLSLHESTTQLYAAVGTRSGSPSSRGYRVRFTLEEAAGWASTQPEVIILNFDGASAVRIGYRAPVDVPPFNAANISSRYAGQTETMIAEIVDLVREDYAGLGVEIYASGDPAIPAGEHSTVYFGTYDSQLLGLADNIDPYNANTSQSAILYTDTFALFDILQPSIQEMAQALANVASHEAGHLLGLRHTHDVHDIMDITASARQMMLDQWFRNTDLHATVLPIGLQDAPTLLAWTLGGTLSEPSKDKVQNLYRGAATLDDPNDFYIPRSMLGSCNCGGCDHTQPEE